MTSFHRLALAAFTLSLGVPRSADSQIPSQPAPGLSPNAARPNLPPPQPAAGSAPQIAPALAPPSSAPNLTPPPGGGDDTIIIQYPNTPLTQILLDYEEWTGLKIIRDANIESVTVTIETTGELPKEQAIRYLEASLLLNGYAFVPAGPGLVKILAADAKRPSTEGTQLYTDTADLPGPEQVVTFIATLKHLNAEDAVKAIDQIVPRHSYGLVQAVENMKALVIIENTATIRAILAVLTKLDVPPQPEIQKSFQLTRADADEVASALGEILEQEEGSSGGGPGARGGVTAAAGGAPRPATPGGPASPGGAPASGASGISVSSGGAVAGSAKPPKIVAIPRTNRILVIGTADAIEYVGKLIEELDAPIASAEDLAGA